MIPLPNVLVLGRNPLSGECRRKNNKNIFHKHPSSSRVKQSFVSVHVISKKKTSNSFGSGGTVDEFINGVHSTPQLEHIWLSAFLNVLCYI